MKAFVCGLVVVLAICSVALGARRDPPSRPGIKVALSQASNYFVDELLPLAYQTMVETAVIPDLSATINVPDVGDVNLTLKKMKFNNFGENSNVNARVYNDNGNTMLSFSEFISAYLDVSWYYVLEDKSSAYGTGTVYTDAGLFESDVKLMTDSTGHPSTKWTKISFGFQQLTFKLSDGPSWLNDVVAKNFNNALMDVINEALLDTVREVIEPGLNKILAQTSFQVPIDKTFSIDNTLVYPDGIIATSDKLPLLVFNTAGEFFPTGGKPGNMPGEFATLPNNATGQQVQIVISENTVLSFMQTAINAGIPQIVFSKDMFSSFFADFFTTGFFARYAPGIATKYGNSTEVVIFVAVRELGDFMFDKSGIGVKSPVEMTIRAKNNSTGAFEDAFTLSLACAVSGIVKVDEDKFYGNIDDITAIASLVSSKVGDVDVDSFNDLIETGILVGLDKINEVLEKGTPIPSLPHVVKLLDPSIVYGQDYAVFATDVWLRS